MVCSRVAHGTAKFALHHGHETCQVAAISVAKVNRPRRELLFPQSAGSITVVPAEFVAVENMPLVQVAVSLLQSRTRPPSQLHRMNNVSTTPRHLSPSASWS